MKEKEQRQPNIFDQMNEYLRKEAPDSIENPTVQGIAERLGIPKNVLYLWLEQDSQFKEEMQRLKEFQENDPMRDGTAFDYFIHSSGVAFILDETKKRYTV